MPPGPKKRKAARRKNQKKAAADQQQDPPVNPNPNSNSLPPRDPHGCRSDAGSGKERVASEIEEEGDEMFQTPKFQPETPRYLTPETPYYSMENLKMARIDEIEELDDEKSKGSDDVAVSLTDYEGSEDSYVAPGEVSSGLIMKLDEAAHAGGESSPEKEVTVGKLEDEQSVPVDKETTPKVSIEAVDVSSSNEKEVKVVPWVDEEMQADQGDVHGVVEVARSEKGGDSDGKRSVEGEAQSDKGETKSESLSQDQIQPTAAMENFKGLDESVQESSPKGSVGLSENKIDQSVEKKCLPVENSDFIAEESGQDDKALDDKHKASAEKSNSMTRGGVKEAESSVPAEKTGSVIIHESKPHPAKIWNCCGLFDVFTSNDR